MPQLPLHPGVYIDELSKGPPAIAGVSTSIALFIGVTASGPRGLPGHVRGVADFQTRFGIADVDHPLGFSIGHFFANGGSDAWVVALDGPMGTAAFRTALLQCFDPDRAVDGIDRFDLLCVPGETDPATLAALQAACAIRRVFLIADCAADATAASLARGPDPLLLGPSASHAALHAPWVVAIDPVSGASRPFPPSGFVAGVYARIDAQQGVWKAPAGVEAVLKGATALTVPLPANQGDAINAAGIDTLKQLPDRSIVIWGARTLAGGQSNASEYRYVPVRRLTLFIEGSVQAGLQWTVFEPNTEPTWAKVRESVSNFLDGLWRQGALMGRKTAEAYFVHCDRNVMTQGDIDAGRLIVQIGVAPLKPAEFVVISLLFRTTA